MFLDPLWLVSFTSCTVWSRGRVVQVCLQDNTLVVVVVVVDVVVWFNLVLFPINSCHLNLFWKARFVYFGCTFKSVSSVSINSINLISGISESHMVGYHENACVLCFGSWSYSPVRISGSNQCNQCYTWSDISLPRKCLLRSNLKSISCQDWLPPYLEVISKIILVFFFHRCGATQLIIVSLTNQLTIKLFVWWI